MSNAATGFAGWPILSLLRGTSWLLLWTAALTAAQGSGTEQQPPANDFFTNRIALSGLPVLAAGHTIGATREPGDPSTVGDVVCNATVWWSWTASASGRFAAIIMTAAPARPSLSVYSGSTATGLVQVIDWSSRTSYSTIRDGTNCNAFQVLFDGVAGVEYGLIGGLEYPDEAPIEIVIARPPSVVFTSPTNAADFSPGADVPLGVSVADANGPVTAVDYFVRFGALIGRTTTSPWSVIWSNVAVGRYVIVARAVDSLGAQASTEIEMTAGRPVNDDFANRIVLTGVPAVTNGSLLAAGKEIWEPETIGYYGSHSTVWWSWTAPTSGVYAVLATVTNFPALLGVYTGSDLTSLQLQAFTSGTHSTLVDGQYRYHSQANVTAVAGTTYQIVVDGGGTSGNGIDLAITLPPSITLRNPTNGAVFANGSPILFSADVEDVDGAVQRVEFLEIHTMPGYGWSISRGTRTNAPWELISSNATVGSYPILARATDNLGARSEATNRIWAGVSRPVNDDFSQRITIDNRRTNVTVFGSNSWASAEAGELYASRSVWWSWTAPASGMTVIDTCGSSFNADLRLYTGSGPAAGNLAPFGSASGGACSTFGFNAAAGTTYHIAVDGSEGQIVLRLATPAPPPVRLAVSELAGSGIVFSFRGVPGQATIVECSTNLVDWAAVSTNNFEDGIMLFQDTIQASPSQQFYRARQQ